MTDRLPSMLDPAERLTVSCDRPKDLMERLSVEAVDVRQKCLHCHIRKPIDDFAGRVQCSVCREKQRERNRAARESAE